MTKTQFLVPEFRLSSRQSQPRVRNVMMEEAESFWELRREPPQACLGGLGSPRCVTEGRGLSYVCWSMGEGVTLVVEGIAREPRESGWGRKGRHHALCRASELSQ